MIQQLRFNILAFLIGISFAANGANKAHSASETAKKDLYSELTGKDLKKLNDQQLYALMIEARQTGDRQGSQAYLKTLSKNYPKSNLMDNALYVSAENAVMMKDYPTAIRHLTRIEKEFPLSNKRVSAMYLKAMAYEKMNLKEFAKNTLTQIKKKYPGSPESFRANAELKILK